MDSVAWSSTQVRSIFDVEIARGDTLDNSDGPDNGNEDNNGDSGNTGGGGQDTNEDPPPSTPGGGGMSTGQIAGIVVGVLIPVLVLAAAGIWWYRRRKAKGFLRAPATEGSENSDVVPEYGGHNKSAPHSAELEGLRGSEIHGQEIVELHGQTVRAELPAEDASTRAPRYA
jgi:hypothetical protein